MELHNVIPGSAEWLALRAQPNTYTASEAPAMMGASTYMTRSELLAQKHTGLAREVDAATQRRFDAGHDTESKFLPIAEEIIGDELYPVTGSILLDGMRLLASYDGLTENRKIDYEHKLLAQRIVNAILMNGEPDPEHYWQLEHQLLVCGGEKALFVTSEGTKESATTCWYISKPERRAALIAGWKQFAEDLKNYTPPAAAPVVVGEPVQALPAVMVQVSGSIVIKDNFPAFEVAVRDFLEHRLIREPKTDQDFADLDLQIEAMKGAEKALAGAEAQMLAQVQSIDQAKKTKDMLAKLVRDNRLMAEKLLAGEKERRRGEIVAGGAKAFQDHINALNARLAGDSNRNHMPLVPADFAGVIKGLKNLTSMENAVATELARVKIAANEIADRLQANLTYLRENAKDYVFLFADTAEIIKKAPDDLQALVQNRITQHKADEAAREELIRKEEQDRLAKQQADAAIAAAAQATQASAPEPAPVVSQPVASMPVVAQKPAAVIDNGARIKLGEINSRIAPLSITADGLAELGFTHVATEKAAKLYRESDWPAICEALIQHITQVADLQTA